MKEYSGKEYSCQIHTAQHLAANCIWFKHPNLHQPIELGNAFAAQCLSDDEGSETHHGYTPIPVFCLCLPDTICKRFFPARPSLACQQVQLLACVAAKHKASV